MKKNTIPDNVSLIRILKRLCHDNIQPHIKEGNTYTCVGHDCKGTKKTLLIANPDKPKNTWRVSSDRFTWQVISAEEAERMYSERKAEQTKEAICNRFNDEQLAQIYFYPSVILYLVHQYADLVIREAAYNHLPQFRPISRQIKQIITANDKYMYSKLGADTYRTFMAQMQEMYEAHTKDFTILFYSMNNIIKKTYPDYPYDTLRTNALIAIMLCDMHKKYAQHLSGLIQQKLSLPVKHDLVSPAMKQMRFLLGAYVTQDGTANFDDLSIEVNKKIVLKIIEGVDYSLYTNMI